MTCFGTAGYELPYKNIKTINCSINNPHKDYNFSITPKNKNEYENLLLNLNNIKKYKIEKKQILEFFYIKRFHLYFDWMHLGLEKNLDINNRIIKNYYDPLFYSKWDKIITREKLDKIDDIISDFYKNNKKITLVNE